MGKVEAMRKRSAAAQELEEQAKKRPWKSLPSSGRAASSSASSTPLESSEGNATALYGAAPASTSSGQQAALSGRGSTQPFIQDVLPEDQEASEESAGIVQEVEDWTDIECNAPPQQHAVVPGAASSAAAALPSAETCVQCFRAGYHHRPDSDLCIACQLEVGCHACGRCHCWSTNPECSFYGKLRVSHADASQLGDSAPDLFERSPVSFTTDPHTGCVWLEFNCESRPCRMLRGFAPGTGCNCLIYSLQQVIHDQGIACVADVPWIRQQLLQRFRDPGPAQVRERSYLDLQEHWAAMIDLLGASARAQGLDQQREIRASTFTVFGVSQEEARIVAKEGSGPVVLFVLNQGQHHFVPLLRQRVRSSQ
jgi:hypothetical protein